MPDAPAATTPSPRRRLYREVSVCLWDDDGFQALSKPRPNAQTLWIYLLTGRETTVMPGVLRCGLATLAESLDWSLPALQKCWKELASRRMVQIDAARRLIWLPNTMHHHRPKSPNQVKGWRRLFDELPACALKDEIQGAYESAIRKAHPVIQEAWFGVAGGTPAPSTKGSTRRKSKGSPTRLASSTASASPSDTANAMTKRMASATATALPSDTPSRTANVLASAYSIQKQDQDQDLGTTTTVIDPVARARGGALLGGGGGGADIHRPKRKHVAFGWRVEVPSTLHREFLERLDGVVPDPEETLQRWYRTVALAWDQPTQQPIVDEVWDFWRARFRERYGKARQSARHVPTGSTWTCPHDPRCESRWRCDQRTAIQVMEAEDAAVAASGP